MKKKCTIFVSIFLLMLCIFSLDGKAARVPVRRGGKTTTLSGTVLKVRYGSQKVAACSVSGAPAMKIGKDLYLPAKTVFSDAGIHATYSHNPANNKVTLTYGKRSMHLKAGSKSAVVNGTSMRLSKAPFLVKFLNSDITDLMVPARQCSILMGLKYNYDSGKRLITLKEKEDVEKSATRATKISKSRFLSFIGPIAKADYHRTGVLASVTIAQAILESGWGQSSLAKRSNNLFGITRGRKVYPGGGWDGVNASSKGGKYRKYSCVEDSISDHSAYLLNSKNGSRKRYRGLTSTKSYRKQFQIIRRGGYCTSSNYVSQLCRIVSKYHLTKYDK